MYILGLFIKIEIYIRIFILVYGLMMKIGKKEALPIGLILLMFVLGFYFYDQLPEKIPTHWNARGEIDAYGSKTLHLVLIPLISALLYLFFLVIPAIEVKGFRKNINKFYDRFGFEFRTVIVAFFAGLYLITMLIALGFNIKINYFIIPAISIIFFYIGYMIQFAKRNFFIGIRTPWTLSSDVVWKKTHKLGGKLFMAAAVFMFVAGFLVENVLWVVLVPVLTVAIVPMVYSYWIYSKPKKK